MTILLPPKDLIAGAAGLDACNLPPRRALNTPAAGETPAIFADPASQAVQAMLDRLAPTDATLLLIGETGTGKEMAARYVHGRSCRRTGPFLAVNCGALSETLAEAELFGHEKGAFTGAIRSQRGWFEAASGGTLLLDEIGDLPLALQVKLLRVLQEREVTRVGSRQPMPIDVRVIAATNVDLHNAIAEKRFREDLYFRLNVATVMLPPLRERKAGLQTLVQHFLHLYGDRLGRPNIRMSADALIRLVNHTWPGNIRELENVIHNAVLLAPEEVIEAAHLQLAPVRQAAPLAEGASLEMTLQILFERAIEEQEPELLARVTKTLVQSAYAMAGHNQLRAAAHLGTSRNSLRTQLAHLGVVAPRRSVAPHPRGTARPRPQEIQALRIGYQTYGMLGILRAHGALEERLARHGVAIHWQGYAAGPQLLEALQAGQIDFASTGEVPPVFAQAAGAPIVYVAYEPAAPRSEAVVVPYASSIRTIADLRGKRLKLNKGSNVHYLLLRGLEANGMSLQDIDVVYEMPSEPRGMLDGNDADGWALWDPLLTVAQRSKEVRVLFDGTGLVANHQFHIARRAFTEAHPDIIQMIIEGLRHIGEHVTSRPVEAARSLSPKIGIDVPTLEITFNQLTHGARQLDQDVVWEQQKIADRFYALGLIPKAIFIRDTVWAGPG